jgi:hypothetical protein
MKSHKVLSTLILTMLLTALAILSPCAALAQVSSDGDGIGTANFTTDQRATNFSAKATTIPYFRSSFTDPTNGVTYLFTMVGTDPSKGDASTTIATVIIPFRFTFVLSADPNNVLDGGDKVSLTVQSPVFQSTDIGLAASTEQFCRRGARLLLSLIWTGN